MQVTEDSAQTELAKPVSNESDLKIPKVKFHPEIYDGGLQLFPCLSLVLPFSVYQLYSQTGSPHGASLAQSILLGRRASLYPSALSRSPEIHTHCLSLAMCPLEHLLLPGEEDVLTALGLS